MAINMNSLIGLVQTYSDVMRMTKLFKYSWYQQDILNLARIV